MFNIDINLGLPEDSSQQFSQSDYDNSLQGSPASKKNNTRYKISEHSNHKRGISDISSGSHIGSHNDEWEIKTLKKAGVLEWSESERESSLRETFNDDVLKHNRIKFLESINNKDQLGNSQNRISLPLAQEKLNLNLATEEDRLKTDSERNPIEDPENSGISAIIAAELSKAQTENANDVKYSKRERKSTSRTNAKASSVTEVKKKQSVQAQQQPMTREELQACQEKQKEAAIRIQASYKGMVQRDRYKLMKNHQNKFKRKKLLLRKQIVLAVKSDQPDGSSSKNIYLLVVYFEIDRNELYFYLLDLIDRFIYDAFVEIPADLRLADKNVKSPNSLQELKTYAEQLAERLSIDGHILIFNMDGFTKSSRKLTVRQGTFRRAKEDTNGSKPKDKEKSQNAGFQRNQSAHESDDSSDDAQFKEFKLKKKNQPQMANVSEMNKAASKLVAAFRRYLARKRFLLLLGQKLKIVHCLREKLQENMLEIRIGKVLKDNPAENLQKNDILILVRDFTDNTNFKKFLFPRPLLAFLKDEKEILNFVDLDIVSHEIELKEKYRQLLEPKDKVPQKEIDIKKLITIQKNIRRYLAQRMYQLRLEHKQRMNGFERVKYWMTIFDNLVFKFSLFYNPEKQTFKFKTASLDYNDAVEDLLCNLASLVRVGDSSQLKSTMIRRIGEVASNNVILIRESNQVKISLKIPQAFSQVKELFKDPTVAATEEPDNRESSVRLRALRKKLDEDIFQKHIDPNFEFQIRVANVISSYNAQNILMQAELSKFSKETEKAAIYIQKAYRRHIGKVNFNKLMHLSGSEENNQSVSLLLLHTLIGKSSAVGSEADSHAKYSSNQNTGIRASTSNEILFKGPLEFNNKTRSCQIVVSYRTADVFSKVDYILVDLVFDITKVKQALRIPILDVMPLFNKKEFEKKIRELLLEKLEFSQTERKVVFKKSAISWTKPNKKEAEKHKNNHDSAALMIQKLIKAKLARKKYQIIKLSKKRAKFPLKTSMKKIGSTFFQIDYLYVRDDNVIEVVAKLIDDSHIRSKESVKIERLKDGDEIIESIRRVPGADQVMIKRWFSDAISELDSEIILNFSYSVIKISFTNLKEEKVEPDSHHQIEEEADALIELATEDAGTQSIAPGLIRLNTTKRSKGKDAVTNDEKQKTDQPKGSSQSNQTQTVKDPQKEALDNAAVKIQKNFRGRIEREKLTLSKESRAKMKQRGFEARIRRIGNFIYRDQGKVWIINMAINPKFPDVYRLLAYEADVDDSKKRNFVKGTYSMPRHQLINTNGKELKQHIIDSMVIRGNEIMFNGIQRPDNYTKLKGPSEEPTSNPQLNESAEQIKTDEMEDLTVDKYSFTNDDKNVMVFNVMYNSKTTFKPKQGKLSGLNKSSNPLKNDGVSKEPKNIVRVDIDYNNLKKFAPHLNPRDSQDLLGIATELSNSIRISKEGELLVNSAKLNPSDVRLMENNFSMQKSDVAALPTTQSKAKELPNKKKVLVKTSKLCGEHKYLFVISSIERLGPTYETENQANIDVLQEYEVFLDIAASCLSNVNKPRLNWELSISEAQTLLNITDPLNIAKEIASGIQIFAEKFLLPISGRTNANYEKALIINDFTLRKIQKKIRARKFQLSYKAYNQQMKDLARSTIYKSIFALNDLSFIVLCVEESKERFKVITWDTVEYIKYELTMDKSTIQRVYEKDSAKAFRIVIRNLNFEQDPNDGFRLALNKKGLQQDLAAN